MVNWSEAIKVAASGIVSVFLVLTLLQILIQGVGAIIHGIEKNHAQKEKA